MLEILAVQPTVSATYIRVSGPLPVLAHTFWHLSWQGSILFTSETKLSLHANQYGLSQWLLSQTRLL